MRGGSSQIVRGHVLYEEETEEIKLGFGEV